MNGWQVSGSLIMRAGQPFSVLGLGLPRGANQNAAVRSYANLVPGRLLYAHYNIPGVTLPGQVQWLNPYAFSSAGDSFTKECVPTWFDSQAAIANEGINPQLCQYGDMQRNFLRAPGFHWGDLFATRRFRITEGTSLRVDAQFYNVLNHPNFGTPSSSAGVPGRPGSLVGFGAITSTDSPPTGLLGGPNPPNLSGLLNANLGGDTSVRMIAFRATVEF